MTEIKNLTETDTIFPNNLFIIYDGTRVRSVEADAVKEFCAQNGIGTDEAFIAGRIANNILYMTRATGEEVAIGDLETFNLADHTISELGNVPPLEADKFLKVSPDGQRIEYSVADPAGDEIGVEDSGSALGKAQNLNFGDQLEVTLNGNTATIDGTVVPSGYKNLTILSAGDDPKTLDTGICYVSGQFVGAPVFPTSDYQGYLVKQKLLKEGEDQSADTDYQLIIYYSIYGTYFLPKYAGTWWSTDDWFTMLTHNTKQEITADKTFKANSHLAFNRQSDDLAEAYKLIADANNFFIRAFSNVHGIEVDSIKIDQNGAVSFPNTWDILTTDQPDNQTTPQEIRAEKHFVNSTRLGFVKDKNAHLFHSYDDSSGSFAISSNRDLSNIHTWKQAVGITNEGFVFFPNTPNIQLTNKEQTITTHNTYTTWESRSRFADINWDRWDGQWPNYFWIGTVDHDYVGDPKGGWSIKVKDPQHNVGRSPNALYVDWSGYVSFPNSSFSRSRFAPMNTRFEITGNNLDDLLEVDQLPENSHLDKIQIRIDEPFDHDVSLALSTHSRLESRANLLRKNALKLDEVGVIDIPIARFTKEIFKPCIHLETGLKKSELSGKGKAEIFFLYH